MGNIEDLIESSLYKEILEALGLRIEDITCYRCQVAEECPYALDPRNRDSYCLAIKRSQEV